MERLQKLQAHGEALETLMAMPEWSAIEERRQVFLKLRDLKLHSRAVEDTERTEAALEWNVLVEFFSELHRAVKQGHEAADQLKRVQPKHD